MQVTLLLPPLTQLNTPYPSIAYLARFLRGKGVSVHQRDLGLELVLRLFSRAGLTRVFEELAQRDSLPEPAWRALALRDQFLACADGVLRFLQGRDPTLARRILDKTWLPKGPRLAAFDPGSFGTNNIDDAARRTATLHLADLADLITSTLDPGFELARYHHHLALGPSTFDPLAERLGQTTLVDQMLDELTDSVAGQVVGLSVPFPGNLYGALRIGRRLKARGARVVMGGGYVNTELRSIQETRIWEYLDALTFDGGEGPLLALLTHWSGGPDNRHRTRTRKGLHQAQVERPETLPVAWYGDLALGDYLQLVDTLNPAHRLWSDGRWNKATLAHGCYWKRCAFCDIQLDYIARYLPSPVPLLVDAVEELIAETGQSGLHLVDEAAPPRLMKELALTFLARGTAVSWWGNIRFEPTFTPDLCRLLAASGLVAVTGGLEVASDDLLARMDKGVNVAGVARTADAFQRAGVLVHAYLMYGFPGQTDQDTVDSMERVRQLFQAGLLSSAFWHRFVLTAHSGIAPRPADFGIEVTPLPDGVFAANDRLHVDVSGGNHDRFDAVLPRALSAWMQGQQLDRPSHGWFDPPLKPAQVDPGWIDQALAAVETPGSRLVWIGADPLETSDGLVLHLSSASLHLMCPPDQRDWIVEVLAAARPDEEALTLDTARQVFPGDWRSFATNWGLLRQAGLLLV
jgi:hypothetical protein